MLKSWKNYRNWTQHLGVIVGLLIAAVAMPFVTGFDDEFLQMIGWPDSPTRIVKRQLVWAEKESSAGLGSQQAEPIREFFSSAKARTRKYAEEVLGWSSKWKLMKDYVTGHQEHPAFLKARFDRLLFSQQDLDAVIETVVATHLKHLDDVDSELLVRLQADLGNLPSESFSALMDRAALTETLQKALHDAAISAQGELRAAVGRELASWIAGEILTQATIQLATSSGIISMGAASGTVTFGVGVVVGLIADAIVTQIYNDVYDPTGELKKQLDQRMDELQSLIVSGTPNSPGLMNRLQDYSARRIQSRRAALRNAVLTLAP